MKIAAMKNDKAIAILRVSSKRQEGNASHPLQEAEVRQYCEDQGLALEAVFKIVESAKESEDRKKYRDSIAYALNSSIPHVLFYMSDRETRNLTDNEANEKLVRSGKLVLHYVRDRKVIHQGSSESDFMLRDFQALQNKQFSRVLSVKVNDVMAAKARDGWFPNNHPPLGYIHQRLKDERGREMKRGTILVPDPDKGNVRQVVREFELRASGYSYDQIRDQVLAEGVFAGKLPYHRSSIEKRLKNKFYRGFFDWQGVEYRGKHELIIPVDILKKVDASLGKKYTIRKSRGVFGGGFIRCADPKCGCQITYDPKTKMAKSGSSKIFHYYRCSNGKRAHLSLVNVPEEKIWDQFSSVLESISINDDLAAAIAATLNETRRKVEAKTRTEAAAFREGIENADCDEDAAYLDFKNGTLDSEGYERRVARVRAEQKRFSHQLEEAQVQITDAGIETAKTTIELAKSAKALWNDATVEERMQILKRVLSNPVLDGPTLRYDLKNSVAALAEMAKNLEWRPHGDSNPGLLRERELS